MGLAPVPSVAGDLEPVPPGSYRYQATYLPEKLRRFMGCSQAPLK